MKEIKIRFVCEDLSGNIFFLYHTIAEFINGFNLARNGRIEKIISKDVYTGLKDKNGKEIYEGDILTETVNQCRWIYEVRTVKEYGNNLYKVTRYRNFKHDEDGEQIFGDVWVNEGWSQLTGGYEEVIGNIYETPELLLKDAHASIATV